VPALAAKLGKKKDAVIELRAFLLLYLLLEEKAGDSAVYGVLTARD